jgi:hypothetical protein
MQRLLAVLLVLAQPLHAMAAEAWVLAVDGDQASLNLATAPEVDILNCSPGKGVIRVTLNLKRQARLKEDQTIKTPLTINSGAVTMTAGAEAYLNTNTGGTDVAADLPARSPVLTAFAPTGLLKRTALGGASGDPPAPIAQAARFVRLCGG